MGFFKNLTKKVKKASVAYDQYREQSYEKALVRREREERDLDSQLKVETKRAQLATLKAKQQKMRDPDPFFNLGSSEGKKRKKDPFFDLPY